MRIKRKEDSNEKQIRKNQKKAISLALAFAVVAVSMFTVIAVSVSAETSAATELTWDGTYTKPTTTDGDTVVINTASELAWVALKGGTETSGKTYKIADGIKSIYINDVKGLTLTQVENKLESKNTNAWVYQDAMFQGTFDGNGVTVYGLYSEGTYSSLGGLFPEVTGNVTVKNTRVSTSYVGGVNVIGGIIGYCQSGVGTVEFNNCSVINCYLFTTTTDQGWNNGAADLCGGGESPTSFKVNNCLVANNKYYSASNEPNSAFLGQFGGQNYKVENSIALGITPVASNGGGYWVRLDSAYSNVYTDVDMSKAAWGDKTFAETSVKQITVDSIKGESAKTTTALNFGGIWWAVKDSTPELRVFHDLKATDNGDGTHKSVCKTCKLEGFSEEHSYTFNEDYTVAKCSCGVEKTGLTLTWNGTVASGFTDKSTGTAEDPIIITSPEELAYLVVGAGGTTAGKYYKVADCIKAFNMNGMTGITANSTAAQVEAAAATPNKNWKFGEGTTIFGSSLWSNYFQGSFDGNGIVIYNLYTSGSQWSMWAGLFPNVTPTTTEDSIIENLTVTASYFGTTSDNDNTSAGAIVARVTPDNGQKQLKVKNTAVTNSVIKSEKLSGSVIGNTTYNWSEMYNVLVSGITTDDSFAGFIGGATSSQHYLSNCLSIGAKAYKDEDEEAAANNWNGVYSTETTTTKNVTVVTTDDITGAAAKTTLTGFDFDKVWFANKGTPVLRVFHNIKMTDDGDAGHKYACVDCEISDSTVDHTFDTETHKCTVCEYECKHTNKKWVSNNDGDCSVADTGKFVCDCGYESGSMTNPDFTVGHKLAYVAEKSGNCSEEGYAAHKYCSSCKKYFAADENNVSSTKYIDYDDIKTPKNENNHKSIEFVEYKNATTESTGEKSHYECIGCHKLFSDKDGKTEISKKDIEIPKLEIKADWHISASGWYYEFSDGTFAIGWAQINGEWYYFNVSGYMVSNVWIDGYYLSASGAMTTPTWQLDGNGWWYSYGDGTYATGWTDIGGTWYYFNDGGYMVTGWLNLGGTWYYMNTGGAMVTNWQMIGGSWYYFNAGGNMASNVWIGGYYLAPSGVMSTPVWQQNSAGWWYAYGDGSYAIGWEYISGAWCYFNASGYMVTGWQFIDSDWYYFDANGAMTTSVWQSDEDGWKYAYGDGSYAIGWLQIGGQYYYFNSDGYMVIGWLQIGTTNYYLNDSGVMVTDWQQIDGTWYYFDASGAMLRNCWVGDYWLTNSGAINEI